MMGLFGGSKKARDKASSTITENLQIQLGGYIKVGILVGIIQQDPYVAGYIQGKLLYLSTYFTKAEGLPVEDAQGVTGMVLLNLFGKTQAMVVSQTLRAHSGNRSSEFLDGQRKGMQVVAYAVGTKDVRLDPDYERAIATFRAMDNRYGSGPESNDHWAAIAGLERLWFGERMESY
jgi:hypothetical protein